MTSSYTFESVFDLTGYVALVTGGGSGIGLMIAKGFAANGAKTYITGRRKEVLQKVADAWDGKGQIIPIQMDVTNKDSILEVKKHLQETEGRLHVLVNNAGQVGPCSPFMNNKDAPERKDAESLGDALFQEPTSGWSDLYAINTFSIFFVTNAFLGMLDRASRESKNPNFIASVINITSISGVIKLAQDHFCYNSAKAAASYLTKTLSTEFALKGVKVRVNAIAPGVYASEMTYAVIEDPDKIGKGVLPVPAGRSGTEQEMAGTAIYLASPAGCYTNGQEIVIDGGYVAVNPTV